ncbi:DUF302 domain-containing protein [filamentous cyanobacterium LEGE 11480]|uniref:DUF302 domain-containing protein n=1 Tax=Romeriopsis navalis LEGE 11480 TaxID=2777977 RepID=A0A928VLX0_9CYAN|nr:rhodanese-like domain-containing protein [Romeriopsis navalis]MBE9030128.1 DUF302 domain-containing protein [Romeriopsis navalis LEGE 11480]
MSRSKLHILFALIISMQIAGCGSLIAAGAPISQMDLAAQIKNQTAPRILDVRSPKEYEVGHVPGATNIDFRELAQRVSEIQGAKDAPIVVYCETGVRANIAEKILSDAGFTNILHLQGDMSAWRKNQQPIVQGKQPFDAATIVQTHADIPGLIVKTSPHSVEKTTDRLTKVIESKGIKVFATINHSQNAAKADLKLPPTTLVMFGNPKLGTPLMQCQRSIAIDLPQKVLIWQDEKVVKIGYNDPAYIADRHQLNDCGKKVTAKISGALNKFTDVAIAPK